MAVGEWGKGGVSLPTTVYNCEKGRRRGVGGGGGAVGGGGSGMGGGGLGQQDGGGGHLGILATIAALWGPLLGVEVWGGGGTLAALWGS